MSHKIRVYLLFLFLVSSLVSSGNAMVNSQEKQLRDDLIKFDYYLTDTTLTISVSFVDEINDSIENIQTSVTGGNGVIFPLRLNYDQNNDNWVATWRFNDNTPRFIKITTLKINVDWLPSFISIPLVPEFFDDALDVGTGYNNLISDFPVPTISDITFIENPINTSDFTHVTFDTDHPHPDLLNVVAETSLGSSKVSFHHQGSGSFLGSLTTYGDAREKTNLTRIDFTWSANFTSGKISYINGINFTSSVLNVTDGVTDYDAPYVDFNKLKMQTYDNGLYLNITVPIEDESSINLSDMWLGATNTTFSKHLNLEYNATLDLWQAHYQISEHTPEFLTINQLQAVDDFNNAAIFVRDTKYGEGTLLENPPVYQRPLIGQDPPDISAPTINQVKTSDTTLYLNETISIDVYLSDDNGFYDVDNHDNRHWIYITSLDGELKARTNTDDPNYSNDEVQYLTYKYPVFWTIFDFTFPEQLKIGKIQTEDTIGNKDTLIEGKDFTSPIIDIKYPDHWYKGLEDTSSIGETKQTSTPTETDGSTIPILTGPIIASFIVLPLLKRKLVSVKRIEF